MNNLVKKNYFVSFLSLLIIFIIFLFKIYNPWAIIIVLAIIPAILLHSLILPFNKKLSKVALYLTPILSLVILFYLTFRLGWVCGAHTYFFQYEDSSTWNFCSTFIKEVNFEFN